MNTDPHYSPAALRSREADLVNEVEVTDEDLKWTRLPYVYVAGPYASPDPVENSHEAIKVGDALNMTGKVATFVPHLTLMYHLVCPHPVDFWYGFDLAAVARCDALLRMPGKSSGADKEVVAALQMGIPVFYTAEDLLAWAADFIAGD